MALAEKAWDGDEVPSIWDASETDDYTIDWGFGRFTRANVFTRQGEDAPCAVILSITPGNDFVFSEYAIYPFELMLKKLGVAENDRWEGDKQIIVGKTYHGDGFLYILKKIDVDKITEFRSTLEWGAIETGVKQATEEQRQKMMSYLDNLERAETEEERVRWDKAIHYLLIEASGNFCMLVQ